MSTNIDQQVVEMRFDNQHFEKNVQQSMSTIDKLKQSLNLTGASKGLENVNAAAKNNQIGHLGQAAEAVSVKFSAMQIAGITAITNLTNSAMNAGKKILSALTIDPIKTGFQEYETQINAVQTILANTQNKGSTIDDVNKALDELNKYADLTIYNFTEMTRNIGTFTAAGIDLDTSVSAIQGIANLAAVSGSTSQQASTAMYQLSQALATGTVKLMDWNSVVNAGMGGQIFQDALKETSALLGTGAEAAIKAEGSFRESLKKGWLTSEVLTETLKKFTTSGANEYVAEYTGLSADAVKSTLEAAEAQYGEADAIEKASEALAKKSGKNKDEIKQALNFAKTAEDAATKVKTFTQLWDVLKESAQSGWSSTWKLLVGDFEEAKSLLTPLADFLTGVIGKMSDARNSVLESALGKGFTELANKVKGVTDNVKKVTDAAKKYNKIVNEIINGDWGNGDERVKSLTKAGYDWAHAQNLVNEKLGSSVRHATNYKEAQEKVGESQKKNTKTNAEYLASLSELKDSELKQLGFTKDQIKAYRELQSTAEKLGIPLQELIEKSDEINGRWVLINSFKNIGSSIVTIFKSIGEAYRDAFPPMTGDQLFNIIAGFHKFTTYLKINKDTADNLVRTLKGVFAIIDIIASLTGGVFRVGVQIIQEFLKALGYVNVDILSITAIIGDAIVAFRNWFEEHNLITTAIQKIVPFIVELGKAVVNLVKQLIGMPAVQNGIKLVSDAFERVDTTVSGVIKKFKKLKNISLDNISEAFVTIMESIMAACDHILDGTDSIGNDFIAGFVKGIASGLSSAVQAVLNFGKMMLSKLRESIDSHSPSKATFEIGVDFVLGFWEGLKSIVSKVFSEIKNFGVNSVETLSEVMRAIPWSSLFAGGVSISLVFTIKKLADAFAALTAPLEGFGSVLEGVGKVLDKSAKPIAKTIKNFSKILGGISLNIKAKALKEIAIALAILTASIVALTFVSGDDLKKALRTITALAVVLVGISLALDRMSSAAVTIKGGSIKLGGLKSTLIAVAAAILLIGLATKMMGSMNSDQLNQGLGGLIVVMSTLGAFLFAAKVVVTKYDGDISKVGGMMFKLSTAMLLLVGVIKLVSFLNLGEITKGALFMAGFVVFIGSLSKVVSVLQTDISKVGGMFLKLSIAMGLLVGVVKLISLLKVSEMAKGALFMAGFTAFVWGIVSVVKKVENDIPKIGGLLLAISSSMLILVGVMKIISGMETGELAKGLVGVLALAGIMGLLIKMVKSVGNQAPKIALTLTAMAVAIGILAGVTIVLSLISLSGLAKGIVAIGSMAAIMTMMIKATKDATEVKGSITATAIAIGVMAASIAVLSMIDGSGLARATLAIGTLMGMFALIVKSSKGVVKDSMASLIVMTVAIGLIGIVIYNLASLPVDSVLGTGTALSALMLALAGALFVVSKVGGTAKNAIKGIALLTAMIIPLSVFAFALSAFPDISGAAKTVALLTGLMTAMTLLLIPLTLIGSLGGAGALLGVVSLTAMVVPLAAFAYALSKIPDLTQSQATVILLTNLMTAMTLLLVPLTLIGFLAVGALLGVAALTAMVIPLNVFANAINKLPDLSGATYSVMLLASFMDVMTDILMKVTPLAPLAVIGVAAIGALGGVITAFGVLATAVGALVEKFPILQTFLNTGIQVLEGLAEGLGRVVGSFITGFTSEVMTILPQLGLCLSQFMLNATPFITGIKMVDSSVLEGVGIIAATVLALTAAQLIEGITSFLSGGNSFATLGTELSQFMINAQPFIALSKSIDPSIMEGVKSLAQALLTLTAADLLNGLISAFGGEVSFADFGAQLVSFGEAITQFSNTLVANGGVNEEAITAAANAGKIMAELQNSIAPIGGVIQWFTGDKNLADFGTQLALYGAGVAAFSKSVSGENAINEDAIKAAASAGKIMAEVQSSLEPTGGVLEWLTGTTGLDTFGDQLKKYGEGVSAFSKSISGENSIDEDAVNAAANVGKLMAKVQESIPEDKWLDGKISIDDFGKKIKTFGEHMVGYSEKISGVDSSSIAESTNYAKNLVTVAKSASTIDPDKVSNFSKIKNISSAIKDYYDKIENVESGKISASITIANRLVSFINSISGIDTSGVSEFKSAISSLGKTNFNSIADSFNENAGKLANVGTNLVSSITKGMRSKQSGLTSAASSMISVTCKALSSKVPQFANVGKLFMTNMAKGITSQRSKISSSVGDAAKTGYTKARGYYDSYYSAGKYVVSGFASGIDANTYKAEAKAREMAKAAAKAAKEALKINSPSKVFMGYGSGTVEGFVKGISDNMSSVVSSSKGLANNARKSFGKAINKVSDYLNGDMDSQPTIRPVLDLSDVQSGAATIGAMFGNPSVGVMSNLNSISSTMNNRNQNGGNDDIINAIDKLGKLLGNTGGDSYTINGITYDDGSNITDAVKALVRAARVERRR